MDSQTSGSLSRNGTAQTSSKSSYIGGADEEDEYVEEEEEEEEEEITPAELILKLQQVKFQLFFWKKIHCLKIIASNGIELVE